MTAESSTCPHCGAPLLEDSADSFCPRCVLELGLLDLSDDTTVLGDGERTLQTEADSHASSGPTTGERIEYFGDYEILQEIARGGMGVVYKARQRSLNRIVALKMILSGEFAEEKEIRRFHVEAEAAANLQHPNIVAIHEVGEWEGRHYFSMDFVDGDNLAARVQQLGSLDAMTAARWVREIAEAIEYANLRGILHRDLKPQNVLVEGDQRMRVTDFGLARRLDADSSLTVSGTVLGSPAFMPPEQATGRTDRLSPASEVYSIGAILYYCLTGRAPFRGATPVETIARVIEDEPESPKRANPATPADLATICLKCLEKRPEARYPNARALIEDLDRFLNHEPILARPAGRVRRAWNWTQRHPWSVAGLSSVVILGLICLAFGFRENLLRERWLTAHGRLPPSAGFFQPALLFWLFTFPGLAIAFKLLGTFFRQRYSESGRREGGCPRESSLHSIGNSVVPERQFRRHRVANEVGSLSSG